MTRLLLLLVPGTSAKVLAGVLSVVAFSLGLLDLVTRDFDSARADLNLSLGILVFLMLLKFFGLKAAYRVADKAQSHLRKKLKVVQQYKPPIGLSNAAQQALEKAEKAEKAAMATLANELQHALDSIPKESPIRPKYEATLELVRRFSNKSD